MVTWGQLGEVVGDQAAATLGMFGWLVGEAVRGDCESHPFRFGKRAGAKAALD